MAPEIEDIKRRIPSAMIELQYITDVLDLMAGPGEAPLEASVKWLIPKLVAVASELDSIDLLVSGITANGGSAGHA